MLFKIIYNILKFFAKYNKNIISWLILKMEKTKKIKDIEINISNIP